MTCRHFAAVKRAALEAGRTFELVPRKADRDEHGVPVRIGVWERYRAEWLGQDVP